MSRDVTETLRDPPVFAPFERAAGALSYFLWFPAGLWILYRGYVDKRRYELAWFHLVQSTMLASVAGGAAMLGYWVVMLALPLALLLGAGDPRTLGWLVTAISLAPIVVAGLAYLFLAIWGAVCSVDGRQGPLLPFVTEALRKVAAEGAKLGSGG